MNRRQKVFLIVLILCVAPSAQAYIDPGSGMLLWQGVIAAFGLALVFIRNPWRSIKKLIERLRGR